MFQNPTTIAAKSGQLCTTGRGAGQQLASQMADTVMPMLEKKKPLKLDRHPTSEMPVESREIQKGETVRVSSRYEKSYCRRP